MWWCGVGVGWSCSDLGMWLCCGGVVLWCGDVVVWRCDVMLVFLR